MGGAGGPRLFRFRRARVWCVYGGVKTGHRAAAGHLFKEQEADSALHSRLRRTALPVMITTIIGDDDYDRHFGHHGDDDRQVDGDRHNRRRHEARLISGDSCSSIRQQHPPKMLLY